MATAVGAWGALPFLPILWLLTGSAMCVGSVALKKLVMPTFSEGQCIEMWSADFARWWLVHRIIGMTSRLFARHLRGTALLPAYLKALVRCLKRCKKDCGP